MVIFEKNLPDGIIGEVPLKDSPGGKVIGTAKIEKIGSNLMAHIDAAEMPEALFSGFSLGHLSVYDEVQDPVMSYAERDATETVTAFRKLYQKETHGE